MSAPVENPIIVDLTTSFGYMVIGTVFSCMLWGISCMQIFMYYVEYNDDPGFLKLLIGTLWAMDTAGVVLLLTGLWPPLISKWGSVALISAGVPGILHHTWLSGVLSTCVQLLFIWRIYKLGGYRMKWLLPIFLSILCFYQLTTSIAFCVIGLKNDTLAALATPRMKGLQISNRGCTVAVDVLICASLLQILAKAGVPSWQKSQQMVSRLIIVTINSGLWTAIFATISLILMVVQPDGLSFTIVELAIGSLYVTSVLSNLNARRYIRGRKMEWNEFLSAEAPNTNASKDHNDAIIFARVNPGYDSETLGPQTINTHNKESMKSNSTPYLAEN